MKWEGPREMGRCRLGGKIGGKSESEREDD